ncbi:MAG TPA: peptidoglycan-binding domain-containing protein [Thermoanaerobaculia bacterium]|nr:peptidoglycan-binding domain-containing protein [Thermoanaerobaculia bacterium]
MRWKRGDRGLGVKLVQEWLSLHRIGLVIDKQFGAATEHAVRIFQHARELPVTGEVDDATWAKLIEPMTVATAPIEPAGRTLSAATLECAERHLRADAREVGGQNLGPWVRLYMNDIDGERRKWCSGFATYCLHQAAASLGVPPPLPRELSVPRLVRIAQARGRFIAKPSPAQRASIVPGSFFVVRGGKFGWRHIGIVTGVQEEIFTSIEGNSNDDLQTRSYEVCRRIRSYEFETKDFIRVD